MSRASRVLGGLLFLSIALTVLVGGHAYIARRLVVEPGFPRAVEVALLALVWVLAATLVAEPFAQRLLPLRASRAFAWVPSLWLGFGFLLLVCLGASELVTWLASAAALAAPEAVDGGAGFARARAAGVAGVAAVAGAFAIRFAVPQSKRAWSRNRRRRRGSR